MTHTVDRDSLAAALTPDYCDCNDPRRGVAVGKHLSSCRYGIIEDFLAALPETPVLFDPGAPEGDYTVIRCSNCGASAVLRSGEARCRICNGREDDNRHRDVDLPKGKGPWLDVPFHRFDPLPYDQWETAPPLTLAETPGEAK